MEKGHIFKFGTLANAVSSEDWMTTPLEALYSEQKWVAIVTDDAETYFEEINAIVTKVKQPRTCFVIDLHPCANYKHLQERWHNYLMTDKESIEVLLSFIHHHLVNQSIICFDLQDFRYCSVPYPLVRTISVEIGKKFPIDPNAKAMCVGLCFEHDSELSSSYMNVLNENFDEIGDEVYVPWSILSSADNVVEVLYFYKPEF